MATKHEQILSYIANLAVGAKISVRAVAKHLHVSEGTAYRAIKEAEATGLVSAIERVGTIRIEQKPVNDIDSLTFRALLKLIDGRILGGSAGLDKRLGKFVIGAMTPQAMVSYITKHSLVIIGNREEAQALALKNGAAVLITGGFATSDAVITLANEQGLPLLVTNYDTFTVATLINRALSDQAIKQEIATVASIYLPVDQVVTAQVGATVSDFTRLRAERHDFVLPIITATGRLVGIVTPSMVQDKKPTTLLERLMEKDPRNVKPYLSVTAVGHTMQGSGISALPVVDDAWQLLGLVTREAVFDSLATVTPTKGTVTTFTDQVTAKMQPVASSDAVGQTYVLTTTPMMTNALGTLSIGVVNEAVNGAVTGYLTGLNQQNVLITQLSLHQFRPIPLESTVRIAVQPLEVLRQEAVFDVTLLTDGLTMAKAVVTCQLLERN